MGVGEYFEAIAVDVRNNELAVWLIWTAAVCILTPVGVDDKEKAEVGAVEDKIGVDGVPEATVPVRETPRVGVAGRLVDALVAVIAGGGGGAVVRVGLARGFFVFVGGFANSTSAFWLSGETVSAYAGTQRMLRTMSIPRNKAIHPVLFFHCI